MVVRQNDYTSEWMLVIILTTFTVKFTNIFYKGHAKWSSSHQISFKITCERYEDIRTASANLLISSAKEAITQIYLSWSKSIKMNSETRNKVKEHSQDKIISNSFLDNLRSKKVNQKMRIKWVSKTWRISWKIRIRSSKG